MKVLLFDIDGTLIKAGFASRRAFDIAFEEQFGVEANREGVTFYGSTDPDIHHDIAMATFGRNLTPAEHDRLNSRYIELLPAEIADETDYIVLPGVEALLRLLHQRDDVALGLQTGNLEEGAYVKLKRGKLDPYFPFGGFGSDSGDRAQIVKIAVERAERLLDKSIPAHDVTVIGDTPNDIQAGKSYGARTIAVATGIHSEETLLAENPAHVFSDLSANDVLSVLMGE